MNTHGKYDLPPLPEARIVSYQTDSTMRSMELRTHSDEDMRDYARAAIEADRKRRGEPISVEITALIANMAAFLEASGDPYADPLIKHAREVLSAPQPAEPCDPAKDVVEKDNRRAAEQACNVLALRLGYVWNGEDWLEHKPAEPVKVRTP